MTATATLVESQVLDDCDAEVRAQRRACARMRDYYNMHLSGAACYHRCWCLRCWGHACERCGQTIEKRLTEQYAKRRHRHSKHVRELHVLGSTGDGPIARAVDACVEARSMGALSTREYGELAEKLRGERQALKLQVRAAKFEAGGDKNAELFTPLLRKRRRADGTCPHTFAELHRPLPPPSTVKRRRFIVMDAHEEADPLLHDALNVVNGDNRVLQHVGDRMTRMRRLGAPNVPESVGRVDEAAQRRRMLVAWHDDDAAAYRIRLATESECEALRRGDVTYYGRLALPA